MNDMNNERNKSSVILNPERREWVSRSHVISVESVVSDGAKTKRYSAKRDIYGDFAYAQPLKMTGKALSFLSRCCTSEKQKESSLILRKAKFQAIFKFDLSSASGGAGGGKYNRISAFVSMPVLLIRRSLEFFRFTRKNRDDSFFEASPKDSLHRHTERSEGSIKRNIKDWILRFANASLVMTIPALALLFTLITTAESRAACVGATETTAGTDENGNYCGSWDCGAIGSSVICTLSNGTLTISGDGEMRDYNTNKNYCETCYPRYYFSDAPWSGKMVTKAVVEGNVTKIGKSSFIGESYLIQINGTENITTIGPAAFDRAGLTSIDISNVSRLEYTPFWGANKLAYIIMNPDLVIDSQYTLTSYAGPFGGVPAVHSCTNDDETGIKTCGACNGYVKSGTGCVSECGNGYYTDEKAKRCIKDCSNGQVEWQGKCYDEYPFAKKRWTPAEANEWLHDGNDNFVVITFKK